MSAVGLGYRRAVKPDIFVSGGKQLYVEKIGTHQQATLQINSSSFAPGHKVAAPGSTPAVLNAMRHSRGTSNATALTTRTAGFLYEMLDELREQTGSEMLEDEYVPVLIKAILIHSARWGDSYARMKEIIQASGGAFGRRQATRFLGYGLMDPERLLSCTLQRATLLGSGKLANEEAHVYRIPLPPSLSGSRTHRRLTITLAWLSPVRPNTQAYRDALLWFDPSTTDLAVTRVNVDGRSVKNGTVQHEVLEGERATAFVDGDTLSIKVNCRPDAGKNDDAVRYGLVASLEVPEDIDIPIYQEIQSRIRPAIRIEPSESGN